MKTSMGGNYLLSLIHSLLFPANRRIWIDDVALNDGRLRESENDETLHRPWNRSGLDSGRL